MPRVLAFAAACAAATAAAATTLSLQLLPTTTYPDALCNDGTPAGYYFKASDSGSNVFIVHLEGGDWCYDAASCASRAKSSPAMTTSSVWAQNRSVGGFFAATSDPRLSGANLVYSGYCSSDGYAGNIDNRSNPLGWHFRGRATVAAIFLDLIARHGLGSVPHSTVLFSGCSAGGRGALFNAAAVQALLPPNVEHYAAVLDSPYWMDVLPLIPGKLSFGQQTQAVYALTNASGSIDPACQAAFPASGGEGWKCLFGEYALPTLRVPFLLHAYQYDLFQLNWDTSSAPPKTPAQLEYAEMFRNTTRAAAGALVIPPGSAALLPACYKHCNLEDATFSTISTDGWTLEAFLLSWAFGPPSQQPPPLVMEDCGGFNCGHTCPAAAPVAAAAVLLS